MNIKLTLDVVLEKKDKENNLKLFQEAIAPDFEKKGRSDVKMVLDNNKLIFYITSKDFTSIRASINNILVKLRTVNSLNDF